MKTSKTVLLTALTVVFLLFSVSLAKAQSSSPPVPPAPSDGSYVLDQLDWLTPEQEQEINTIISKLDADNLAEIAVVTQNDCGEDTQAYRNIFFRTWGIGHKDRNDGLLILVCWFDGNKDLRKLEQETGTGLEGTIPDLLTSKVAKQYFIPAFSSGKDSAAVITDGDAGKALVAMIKAYDSIIRGATPSELQENSGTTNGMIILYVFLGLMGLLILFFLLAALLGGLSGGGGGSGYYGGSDSSSGSSDSGGFGGFDGGGSAGGGSSSSF